MPKNHKGIPPSRFKADLDSLSPKVVLLKDVQIANRCFVSALDRAIKFHRTNTNDPHNVGNAVATAISEVRDAFKAYIC